MISVNRNAIRIVEKMMAEREPLGIRIQSLSCGATVLDCTSGTLEAGRLFSEICMGGLARIAISKERVDVSTDEPLLACMASQCAGWNLKVPYTEDGKERKFKTSASGPARSLARAERLFEEIGYRDECERAVVTLEVRDFPREEVAVFVARKCGIRSENLFLLFAPTASFTGSVQISARVVEVGMHKMRVLGFPLKYITAASGSAPLAPVGKDDVDAMGKTNDCILYGGETHYTVDCPDLFVERIIDDVPSSSSKDYGKTFMSIYEDVGFEFSRIDPALFSPASIVVENSRTGARWRRGQPNPDMVRESFSY